MNKNIEAAAVEYALDKISVKCPACGMDSLWNNHSNDFKSGAEWAFNECIKIIDKTVKTPEEMGTKKLIIGALLVKDEIKYLYLSSEGEK